MRTIEYNSFEEAVAAMVEFLKQGIRCKGVGWTTPQVWDD